MILILSDPTPAELEVLKRIIGETQMDKITRTLIEIDIQKPSPEWLSSTEFTDKLKKRGYNCLQSITRKKLCDAWGVRYEKRGKEIYFRNELDKIPSRTREI